MTTKEKEYTQLCVWEGVLLEEDDHEEFVEFFEEHMEARIKLAETVWTLPDMEDGEEVPDTGGRSDIFFYVHSEDIPKFAMKRMKLDGFPRWWEDVLSNGHGKRYPKEVRDRYKRTW